MCDTTTHKQGKYIWICDYISLVGNTPVDLISKCAKSLTNQTPKLVVNNAN